MAEKVIGREVSPYPWRINLVQHSREFLNFFHRMSFFYFRSVFESLFDLPDTRRAETIFCFLCTVQRIADTQPVDREKVVLPKKTIAEHWIIQIAKFNKNTGARRFLSKMFQHFTENFFFFLFTCRERVVQKFACTIYYTLFDKGGGEPLFGLAYGSKQTCHRSAFFCRHYQQWSVPWSRFIDLKQLLGMECVIPR